MDFTAGDFAERFGLELIGDGNAPIKGIAYVQDAKEGDLVLADSRKYFSEALLTPASCIVCDSAYSVPEDKTLLVSPRAGSIFLDILESLCPEPYVPSPGAPPVSPACSVGEGCVIAPGAHIGPGSVLGDRVTVYPGVFIGADVTIGPDTIIYSNVSIYDRTEIGASCILHSGCVLGADGFGFLNDNGRLRKNPHIGNVKIGNDVEIGANSAVDRAKLGSTLVGDHCKIDNLVQIGHNVRLGTGCIICGQAGIAGSSTLGDFCVMGAKVGVSDHVHLGKGVMAAAKSGITKDFGDGTIVTGTPAAEASAMRRVEVLNMKLPEIYQRLKAVENELNKEKK